MDAGNSNSDAHPCRKTALTLRVISSAPESFISIFIANKQVKFQTRQIKIKTFYSNSSASQTLVYSSLVGKRYLEI